MKFSCNPLLNLSLEYFLVSFCIFLCCYYCEFTYQSEWEIFKRTTGYSHNAPSNSWVFFPSLWFSLAGWRRAVLTIKLTCSSFASSAQHRPLCGVLLTQCPYTLVSVLLKAHNGNLGEGKPFCPVIFAWGIAFFFFCHLRQETAHFTTRDDVTAGEKNKCWLD